MLPVFVSPGGRKFEIDNRKAFGEVAPIPVQAVIEAGQGADSGYEFGSGGGFPWNLTDESLQQKRNAEA